jgi:hypothetical protein
MSLRTLIAGLCQIVMAVCALLELVMCYVTVSFHSWNEPMFWAFAVVMTIDLFALLAAFVLRTYPIVPVLAGSVLIIASLVLLWPYPAWGDDYEGLLYQHSLEITYLAAALTGFALVGNAKRLKV